MKYLILLSVLSLSFGTFANMCEVANRMEAGLEEKELALESFQAAYRDILLHQQEIDDLLLNNQLPSEVIKLAEQMERDLFGDSEELYAAGENEHGKEEQLVEYAAGSTVSMGTLMISFVFMKKVTTTMGATGLWTRIKTQIAPSGDHKAYRTLLNTAAFVSAVSAVYLGWKAYDTQNEIEELKNTIIKLNDLRARAEEIEDLKVEIDEAKARLEAMRLNHNCS